MIDRATDLWWSLPLWAKWVIGVSTVLLFDAAYQAWGERNFIIGVGEAFVAQFLYWFTILGPICIGILIGVKIFEATSRMWLGWMSGVAVTLVALLVLASLTDEIPGISWRMDAMRNSDCHVDWDGRSNPTVCE